MKKEELSECLREFLKTDIQFEKLTRDDLNKLYNLFNEPENIIGILIEQLGIENFISLSNNIIKIKILEKKPIRNILKSIFSLKE